MALTETTTVYATLTSTPAALPEQASIYSFAMNNGTTSWINGASPTFTSFHIETTVITVYQTASVVPASASGLGTESGTFGSISSSVSVELPTFTSTSLAFSTVTVSSDVAAAPTSSSQGKSISLESTRTSHVISTVTGPAVTIIESLSYVSMSGSTSTLTLHITSTVRLSETLTATSTAQSQSSSSTSPTLSTISVSSQSSNYEVSSRAPITSSASTTTTSPSRTYSSFTGMTTASSDSAATGATTGWVPLSGYISTASSLPITSSFRLSFYNMTTSIPQNVSTADAVQTSAQLTSSGNYSWALIPSTSSTSITSYPFSKSSTPSTSSTSPTSSMQMLPQYHPVPYGDARPSYSSLSMSMSPASISSSVASPNNTTATAMPSVFPAAVSSKSSIALSVYGQLTTTKTSSNTSTTTLAAMTTTSLRLSFPLAATGYFNVTASKTSSAAAAPASASQCGVQGNVLLTVSSWVILL